MSWQRLPDPAAFHLVATGQNRSGRKKKNDWAETSVRPRCLLDLLLSVINLSVQTVEIMERLPKVRFEG